jgi:PTH1 family peptidyl-tRNA hydrolase
MGTSIISGQGSSSVRPRLIVGLGNPGTRYEGTRHNAGFMAVDRLVAGQGGLFQKEPRWKAQVARLAPSKALVVKPETFMNLSGAAVAAIASFHRIAPPEILVIYDDVDLPLGRLRLRLSGSAGGHNGISSIAQSLGSSDFPRLRIGITSEGSRPAGQDLADFVLGRFGDQDRPPLEDALERAVQAVTKALQLGMNAAMNQFNQAPDPK